MKNLLLTLCCLAGLASTHAQSVITVQKTLQWSAQTAQIITPDGKKLDYSTFDGAGFGDLAPTLPVFGERFPLTGRSTLTVEVAEVQYESFSKKASPDDAQIGTELNVTATVEQERNRYFGRVRFVPIRRTGSGFERVVSFTLNVRVTPVVEPATDRGGPHTYTSALQSGTLYKFGVRQSTVYKLDYTFLKNELGINDLDNIDPRTIHIYGNGGKMLPEKTDTGRPDDLIENTIVVTGEQDGKFDNGDFILFYAVGPKPVTYRPSANDPQLIVNQHLYDRDAWYFLKIGDGNGLRVGALPSVAASYVTEEFDDYRHLEDERVNLLDFFQSAQGSGKQWFGDYFYQIRSKEYKFNFPNIVSGSTGRVRAEFAGRCGISTSVRLNIADLNLSRTVSNVSVSDNEASFASESVFQGNFQPASDDIVARINYPEVSQQSEGWLDYIGINARRRLAMTGETLEFRDLKTLEQDAATFRVSNVTGSGFTVWNITNPQAPERQQATQIGSTVEFSAATRTTLRSFVAFYDNAALPKPETKGGKIANQNLHGLENVQMAIVYHPELEAQANQLAEHRRTYSGLKVALINVEQLYNEFSSGAKDPTAIRDFAKMLLERSPNQFEYLLLFGDGSFDPKNNTESADNKDFIPVFETANSFSPIYAYPSDDFFGLLSDGEDGNLTGALDIAVGRITARNSGDAQAVVDKIIAYDSKKETLGDWHLRGTYLGDDEDQNVHLNQADRLANMNGQAESWFNIEKIFFDAYQQISTSAGQRFPDAKAAINSDIFKGTLVVQYIGHGGPRGWAQERVIDLNDIAGWDNPNRYPLIITATCSFGGYDDYTFLTGGEQSLVRPNAGAIGLFTTVRAVYIYANNNLTDAVQRFLFRRDNGQYRTIGNILKDAKNTLNLNDDNARRFTLLGDPAMYLAMPEYRVVTTKINDSTVVAGQPDTLKALMPVNIEGMVTDTAGQLLSSFNGKVYVTIFDKVQTLQTLGQDAGSVVRPFTVQRNVIFKGSATVTNGLFKVGFIVPKDINYAYGAGKISYYAENGTPLDAAGADRNIVIGGNANLVQDNQPPLVVPFLNTDAFVSGGITNMDPKVLVKCSDDYGMNVSGTSLGHDLVATLDDNVLEAIVLNDFYESEKDNFRKGQAIYPLRNLAPGRHKLRVKGWDIANNPGEGYTEFVVAEDGKVALDHVLNYPNPFTTNTNFQFEHNLAAQMLDIQVSIFSVSGKLVKTIIHNTPNADGFRVTDIAWDGKDDYGDQLARGVYLYRVKVRGTDIAGATATAESSFEKLVILK